MLRLLIAVAFVPCLSAVVTAQCDERTPPWMTEAGALHGSSVDIDASGNVIVAGAPEHTQPGLGATGHVTVSRWNGAAWTSTPLPVPTTLGSAARFGHAVAVDEAGDTIVVGCPLSDAGAVDGGLVAVYEWQAGSQSWAIEAEWPGLFAAGGFGGAVSISGEVVAVGEPTGGFGNGTVNLFRRTAPATWSPDGFLLGAAFLDGFGWSVAVDGDRLAVGSPFFDESGFLDSGRVDFYERIAGVWTPAPLAIWPHGPEAESHLGWSVALDGDLAIAGQPDWGAEFGTARPFHWDGLTWIPDTGLAGWHPQAQGGFSVALLGDLAVFGEPGFESALGADLGTDAGMVEALRWNGTGWDFVPFELFTNVDVAAGDRVGTSVALGGSRVVTGAPFADTAGADSGTVRVRDFTATSTITDLGHALAGTLGDPVLEVVGSGCGYTPMNIELTNALPGALCWLIMGFANVSAPFKGGVLVPKADIVAGPVGTGPAGWVPVSFAWPVGPSFSFWVQWWIADPAAPKGLAASNGLEVTTFGD